MKLSFASLIPEDRPSEPTIPTAIDAATMRELREQLALATRIAREGARRRSIERERRGSGDDLKGSGSATASREQPSSVSFGS